MRLTALPRLLQGALFGAALACMSGAAHAATPAKAPAETAATEAFWRGDFAELERQYKDAGKPDQVDANGILHMSQFRSGLDTVFNYTMKNEEAYLKEIDLLTLQWAKEHPQSSFAHILHAKALFHHGWSYRGGGFVKDVPPEAWKDFEAYLKRAVDYLAKHADVALQDSYAHVLLLNIGRALSWNPRQLGAIAKEGLRMNPEDTAIYFAMADALLPKWGGDAKVLDDYIRRVAEQTRERHGLGLYARLYSGAAENQFGHALFEDSHADWDKMKQGFEDMLARHPDSAPRLNRYAYMACLAKDRDTVLRLLGKLGERVDAEEWGANGRRSLESCKRWASET